jgi:hypothetical protein
MRAEFRAIIHSEYGAPEKVLRIAKRRQAGGPLAGRDVLEKGERHK